MTASILFDWFYQTYHDALLPELVATLCTMLIEAGDQRTALLTIGSHRPYSSRRPKCRVLFLIWFCSLIAWAGLTGAAIVSAVKVNVNRIRKVTTELFRLLLRKRVLCNHWAC